MGIFSGRGRSRIAAEPHVSARERRALDVLHDKGLNFEPLAEANYTPADGWRVDHYRQPLPAEPPGRPLPGGPYAIAQQLMRDYEFADPRMVRAVYSRESPLEGRDMLLELRFFGVRLRVGCRVGGVRDEVREHEGRKVAIWGWNYRTLQGHLEMGQMDYELWKWLDDGAIEFRIHVVSRAGRIPNPIVRLGFRLVGRRMQVRFARHACERMLSLTEARLQLPERDPAPPPSANEIDVHLS
ncbi:MAG: hypothetical protein NVSMB51_01680 [Solirubrobacteraceae bacterium]